MIGRTNALRAAQGGVTEGEKPAASYSGKWTGWRLAFYKGVPYWEAEIYTSGVLTVTGTLTADIWGIGGGPFDYSGVMSRASTATVLGAVLSGEVSVTVGAGATKNARGNGGDSKVGDVFTAKGGVMNVSGTGARYRFGDADYAYEEGTDGASNGYAHGEGGWLHWRCGVDNGDGTGFGAGGDYGGYGNALVNAHPGALVVRTAYHR